MLHNRHLMRAFVLAVICLLGVTLYLAMGATRPHTPPPALAESPAVDRPAP